jgi:hypothetical protein
MARKEKKYHFIYKTTNLKNGKYYVGMHSTDDLNDGYLGSGTRLRRSIRRNGAESFNLEILEFFDNRIDLANREKQLVNEDLLKDPMCMNIQPGGGGGFVSEAQQKYRSVCGNKKHNELLKIDDVYRNNFCMRISEAQKKRHDMGVYKSNLDKIHKSWVGKSHKPETIEKIKQSKIGCGLGFTNSQFGTCWITNGTESKKVKKTNVLPDGWSFGRKIN